MLLVDGGGGTSEKEVDGEILHQFEVEWLDEDEVEELVVEWLKSKVAGVEGRGGHLWRRRGGDEKLGESERNRGVFGHPNGEMFLIRWNDFLLLMLEGFGNEEQKVIVLVTTVVGKVRREVEMDEDGGQGGEKVAVERFDDQLKVAVGEQSWG